MTVHDGSCHCGAVQFRVTSEFTELTTCDCSLCVKRNAVMAKAPQAALTVTQGQDRLTLYEWNTRRAKHYFCRICGIYVFHRKRSEPDHYGINVFCLDGFDPSSLAGPKAAEGASMTVVDPDIRTGIPGPRAPSC